jgi:hypothetical protein
VNPLQRSATAAAREDRAEERVVLGRADPECACAKIAAAGLRRRSSIASRVSAAAAATVPAPRRRRTSGRYCTATARRGSAPSNANALGTALDGERGQRRAATGTGVVPGAPLFPAGDPRRSPTPVEGPAPAGKRAPRRHLSGSRPLAARADRSAPARAAPLARPCTCLRRGPASTDARMSVAAVSTLRACRRSPARPRELIGHGERRARPSVPSASPTCPAGSRRRASGVLQRLPQPPRGVGSAQRGEHCVEATGGAREDVRPEARVRAVQLAHRPGPRSAPSARYRPASSRAREPVRPPGARPPRGRIAQRPPIRRCERRTTPPWNRSPGSADRLD